ncbi:Uu.00g092720.m01.CDS01 [Anthostomella pinea]|uniref:Uu.00g092720.m01.CDS01 n=1 Tax=Anthostomella pinea TaxID=933095 RepID=A0AAI8YKD4_9PEZI|nr:Uu.00g092720.m01.CDS01 [Anthostomella pinea]
MSNTPFCPQKRSHAPEELISAVMAVPPKTSLRHAAQDAAKKAFVALYLQPTKPSTELLLVKYMAFLDPFFFFESLCQDVSLHVSQEDPLKPGRHGVFFSSRGEIRIFLNPKGGRRKLDDVLSTLIHEMVHAYLLIFSKKSLAKSPGELYAHDCHGVYWSGLFLSIVNVVRSWHPKLNTFVTRVKSKSSQKAEPNEKESLGLLTKKLTKLSLEEDNGAGGAGDGDEVDIERLFGVEHCSAHEEPY